MASKLSTEEYEVREMLLQLYSYFLSKTEDKKELEKVNGSFDYLSNLLLKFYARS